MSCRYPYLTPCLRSLYVCYCIAIKFLREVFCRHVGNPKRGLKIKDIGNCRPVLLKGQGPSSKLL